MSTAPNFPNDVKIGMVQISTANTNRDGTGTIGSAITGAKNGTKISHVVAEATGTTTAGMIRYYIDDGTNVRLWHEIAVSAITPSATVKAFRDVFTPTDELILPQNYEFQASTHNAEEFNIFAHGGDFSV